MLHLLNADYLPVGFPLRVTPARHGTTGVHCHEFYELVYVIGGRGTHSIGDSRYPIRTGDVYVISPNEPHAYDSMAGVELRIVNVLFLPAILDESLLSGPTLSGLARLLYIEPLFREEARFTNRLNLQGAPAYRVEMLLQEMEEEQETRAPGYELVLKNTFCTLLVLLSRAYEQQIVCQGAELEFTRRHAVVEAALRYIEAHHTEPLSVADVAQHTAMSASRLAHLFKEGTRRSVLAYLHKYRINRICAELLRTDAPVGELAASLGYGDLRFFHRVFRRHTGCSPTEYRRVFRAASPKVEAAAL
jgi:AraC-like DNA-binding protein